MDGLFLLVVFGSRCSFPAPFWFSLRWPLLFILEFAVFGSYFPHSWGSDLGVGHVSGQANPLESDNTIIGPLSHRMLVWKATCEDVEAQLDNRRSKGVLTMGARFGNFAHARHSKRFSETEMPYGTGWFPLSARR